MVEHRNHVPILRLYILLVILETGIIQSFMMHSTNSKIITSSKPADEQVFPIKASTGSPSTALRMSSNTVSNKCLYEPEIELKENPVDALGTTVEIKVMPPLDGVLHAGIPPLTLNTCADEPMARRENVPEPVP